MGTTMKSLHTVLLLSTMIALTELRTFLIETKKSEKYTDRDVVDNVGSEGSEPGQDYGGSEYEYHADYTNNDPEMQAGECWSGRRAGRGSPFRLHRPSDEFTFQIGQGICTAAGCLDLCQTVVGALGCEFRGSSCFAYTEVITQVLNENSGYKCWIFNTAVPAPPVLEPTCVGDPPSREEIKYLGRVGRFKRSTIEREEEQRENVDKPISVFLIHQL